MPNECSNRLTITSTCESDIENILQEIHQEIPNLIITPFHIQNVQNNIKIFFYYLLQQWRIKKIFLNVLIITVMNLSQKIISLLD
jgi:hypothetical protein